MAHTVSGRVDGSHPRSIQCPTVITGSVAVRSLWERHDRIFRRVVVGERLQLSNAIEEHLIVRLGYVLRSPGGFKVLELVGHPLAGQE